MTNGQGRLLRVLGVAAFIAAAFSSPASANNEDTISGCVSRDGRVRIMSPLELRLASKGRASPCERGERLVTWNRVGPPGPPGPRGRGFDGIQYYTVGNGDLRPVGGGFFGIVSGPAPGGMFSTAAAPLLAGVHLPQNATVLGLRAHLLDNSASNLSVELVEQQLSSGMPATIASVMSTGAAAAPYFIDALPFEYTVDNALFQYYVRVTPNPGWTTTTLQLVAVTITYALEPPPGS